MSLESQLRERAGEQCELCGSSDDLRVREIPPADGSAETAILVCAECDRLMDDPSANPNVWHCLNESMWSTEPAVQVMAYRLLKRIASEGWPQELLDMMYMEPEVLSWAEETDEETGNDTEPTRDSNGAVLEAGDSVTIIKDLEVKGAGFTAKRGTVVKNITLTDNPEQIEGRVNGTRIVLLSKFLKKMS